MMMMMRFTDGQTDTFSSLVCGKNDDNAVHVLYVMRKISWMNE